MFLHNISRRSRICYQVITEKVGQEGFEVEFTSWGALTDEFIASIEGQELTDEEVKSRFERLINEWIVQKPQMMRLADKAMQRYHDYYVRLQRQGQLTQEDESHDQIAMEREQQGLVDPLSEDDPQSLQN